MSGPKTQDGQNTPVKRGDGTVLQDTAAPRNSMKRMMDNARESQNETSTPIQRKDPVIRGDGTVLPERTETQPRNAMKRMMDTSHEGNTKEL
jgi:hypothetical protein